MRLRKHLNGNYVSISDKQVKKNIQPLDLLLEKVIQLEPVEYEMIHHDPQYSLIKII